MLKNIRKALYTKVPNPYVAEKMDRLVVGNDPIPDVSFAENFVANGGHFRFCENIQQAYEHLNNLIKEKGWQNIYCWDEDIVSMTRKVGIPNIRTGHKRLKMDAAICEADLMIAETGTLVIRSGNAKGSILPNSAPALLVIGSAGKLRKTNWEALSEMNQTAYHSNIQFISGLNVSFDIEGLAIPGYGPEEIHFFWIEENSRH